MARTKAEVISEMVDSGLFSDDEIRAAVKGVPAQPANEAAPAQQQAVAKPMGPFATMNKLASDADPTRLIKRAAPSNLLPLMGVASVNAPSATTAAVNMIPGIGDPTKVLPAIKGVIKNPRQIPKALQRMGAVQSGGRPTEQEALPVLAGKVAGTVIEATAQPSLSPKGIKARGPFTAGLKDPSTAIPGSFERAGQALNTARGAARAGESASEASRLRVMLQKPAGVTKVAEEAKAALEAGKELTVTQLLAYKDALGQMQARGGAFANDYKMALDLTKELIAKKAPDLAEATGKMAVNYLAKGNGPQFPWFTTALDPKVGVAKMATMPVVRNAVGAALNPAVKVIPKLGSVAKLVKTLTEDKAREFLRKAKGLKDKARDMAIREGWQIPQ